MSLSPGPGVGEAAQALDPANRGAAARRICTDPDSDCAGGGGVSGAGTRPGRAGTA